MKKTESLALQNVPLSRPSGRSARVAQKVMNATLSILSEQGVEALTFERVASEAQVNRTTLYRRWGTKPRLMTWALLEFMEGQAQPIDTGSIRSDLMHFLNQLNQFMGTSLAATFVQIAYIEARKDEAVSKAVDAYWEQRIGRVYALLEQAIQRGELAPDIDKERFWESILGPFHIHHFIRRKPLAESYIIQLVESTLLRFGLLKVE